MKADESRWKQMKADESGWQMKMDENIRCATCISDAVIELEILCE